MKDLTRSGETLMRTENNSASIDKAELPVTQNNNNIVATLGSIITFELHVHEENEKIMYTLKLVDHLKSADNEVSIYSPIGKNIYKTYIGESKTYTLNKRNFTITILDIKSAV